MTMMRPALVRVIDYLRVAYATVAFSAAVLLFQTSPLHVVHAQTQGEYALQQEHRFEIKSAEIDHHLEATDARVQELSDRTSAIQGVGAGAFGVLTVLQILGIIASKSQK